MSEKFEKGVFTMKTHQISSKLRRRNLKTQQLPAILDQLCSRKTREGKSYDYRDFVAFKMFSVHTRKRKAGDPHYIIKFLGRFEERFRNALFSRRISVDGWPYPKK